MRLPAIIIPAGLLLSLLLQGQAQPTPARGTRPTRPTQEQIDEVTKALRGTDRAEMDNAVVKIKTWMPDFPLVEIWSTWMPALRNAGRHQDIADISLRTLTNPNWQPANDAISVVVEFRVNALLAMGQPEDALQAAKSYYNVCDLRFTTKAVDLVGTALAKAHPDDMDIVRKFREEQAKASGTTGETAVTPGEGMLRKVSIDARPFANAIDRAAGRTAFRDRAIYANLLLITDKSKEGFDIYRELYQTAATPDELKLAAEGVARALRAQDGNVARANDWLAKLTQAQAK